jgi:hypothetical protein
LDSLAYKDIRLDLISRHLYYSFIKNDYKTAGGGYFNKKRFDFLINAFGSVMLRMFVDF